MTVLQSDPSSTIGTRILCLQSNNYTPGTTCTPTATVATATRMLSSSVESVHPVPQPNEQELEELDIQAELRADGDQPFPIDRRMIKEVVLEKLCVRVERVSFLSAGTFHKVRGEEVSSKLGSC